MLNRSVIICSEIRYKAIIGMILSTLEFALVYLFSFNNIPSDFKTAAFS